MSTDVVPVADIEYPSSDGKPMAESDTHRRVMVDVIDALRGRFAADPAVYVSGNLLVYYEEGNPSRHLAPDCFAVRGVPNHDRETYRTWEEGRFPDFVLEVTSKTTRREDLGPKLETYRDVWKVREYFLFDPREEYLTPSFRGFRLADGVYHPVPTARGQLFSEVLGLRLEREGVRLVFRDPGTGRRILRPEIEQARRAESARELAEAKAEAAAAELEEAIEGRRVAEDLAAREAAARQLVEAEVARLRAELAAVRNPPAA